MKITKNNATYSFEFETIGDVLDFNAFIAKMNSSKSLALDEVDTNITLNFSTGEKTVVKSYEEAMKANADINRFTPVNTDKEYRIDAPNKSLQNWLEANWQPHFA